jgi:hypothetical protein
MFYFKIIIMYVNLFFFKKKHFFYKYIWIIIKKADNIKYIFDGYLFMEINGNY